MVLTFNGNRHFSNKSNIDNDYNSTIVTGRTLRENLVSARVGLKQERGELLKIKNEKSNLRESYIQQHFEYLKEKIKNHKYNILSLNVMKNKVKTKNTFIEKLDNIYASVNYYTTNNQISQQEFEFLIKDIVGQINNL